MEIIKLHGYLIAAIVALSGAFGSLVFWILNYMTGNLRDQRAADKERNDALSSVASKLQDVTNTLADHDRKSAEDHKINSRAMRSIAKNLKLVCVTLTLSNHNGNTKEVS
jgi:hypothetical protein